MGNDPGRCRKHCESSGVVGGIVHTHDYDTGRCKESLWPFREKGREVMASSLLTALVTALGNSVPTALSAGLNTHADANSQIDAYLNELPIVVNDPVQVRELASKIMSVPGRPLQATVTAIQMQANAANPALVLQLAASLHAYILGQSQSILTSMLNSVTGTVTVGS